MRKKRTLLTLVGMMLFAAVTGYGCGKEKSDIGEQKQGICSTYSQFTASFLGNFESFCDRGRLYHENEVLMFQEYENGKRYPLCSETYCEHKGYSKTNPNPTCEAAIMNVTAAAIYGHEVYVFCESTLGTTSVMVRDLYGSGYKELVQLPYSLTHSVAYVYNLINGDKAYLITADTANADATSGISFSDYPTVILELDLKTGKYVEWFRIQEGPQIQAMKVMKKGLAVYCMEGKPDSSFPEEENLNFNPVKLYDSFYFVDFKTGDKREITSLMSEEGMLAEDYIDYVPDENRLRFIAFSEQGIYVQKGRNLYDMDPMTEELTLLWTTPKEYDSFYASQGEQVLLMSVMNADVSKRGLFQMDSKTFYELDYGEDFYGVRYLADDYFICSYKIEEQTVNKLFYYTSLLAGDESCLLEWE